MHDELRGMGLDMGVGAGSNDVLTSGMGFAETLWSSSFGNAHQPVLSTPAVDPSKSRFLRSDYVHLLGRHRVDTVADTAQLLAVRIGISQPERRLAHGGI